MRPSKKTLKPPRKTPKRDSGTSQPLHRQGPLAIFRTLINSLKNTRQILKYFTL